MRIDQRVDTMKFTSAHLYLTDVMFHVCETADIVIRLYGRVFADALPFPLCRPLSYAAVDPLSWADRDSSNLRGKAAIQ